MEKSQNKEKYRRGPPGPKRRRAEWDFSGKGKEASVEAWKRISIRSTKVSQSEGTHSKQLTNEKKNLHMGEGESSLKQDTATPNSRKLERAGGERDAGGSKRMTAGKKGLGGGRFCRNPEVSARGNQ